jgi:hypothetical protein
VPPETIPALVLSDTDAAPAAAVNRTGTIKIAMSNLVYITASLLDIIIVNYVRDEGRGEMVPIF